MKTTLFAVCLFVTTAVMSQSQAKPFSLKGTVKNISGVQKIYLQYRSNGEAKLDSTMPVNNEYEFKGSIFEPLQASLRIQRSPSPDGKVLPPARRDVAMVYLSPTAMEVASVDSFSNIKVSGSPAHDEMNGLDQQLKPINDRDQELYKEYTAFSKTKDEAGMNKVEAASEALEEERKKIYKTYLNAKPNSPVAIAIINKIAGYDIDADKVQPLFDKLSASAKALPSAVDLQNRITIARKTGIGRMAMDFTQNDTLGTPVSLSSLRGKVLLVDFWASWCGPCRRENPNVVKAFTHYKDKGFHILGVSLDQPNAKERWVKAIHDDELTWTHVSDLKYWDNAVAKDYGIRAIPFNLLLDKEGKIIGKNLRGEALEKKLAEVFSN